MRVLRCCCAGVGLLLPMVVVGIGVLRGVAAARCGSLLLLLVVVLLILLRVLLLLLVGVLLSVLPIPLRRLRLLRLLLLLSGGCLRVVLGRLAVACVK